MRADADKPQGRALAATTEGLDRDHPVMWLWRLAKRDGIWDPMALDLEQDQEDWAELAADERQVLEGLASVFLAGEESVTRDLLPLIGVVGQEGRLEEEMYLTTFLWEEAKHVEFFWRFFEEIAGTDQDLTRFHSPSYQTIFYVELPTALDRLKTDPSPVAQARASVTYNMVVEGVLAETGYHAYFDVLERRDILPGIREGVGNLKRDESRHLAYGVYLLSRLVADHGDEVWHAVEDQLDQLVEPALGVVEEFFEAYDPVPFGLDPDDFLRFAAGQLEARRGRLVKAREEGTVEVEVG